jgi:hypothetical protein
MGLYDFTTKEILNKIFRTAGGGTVAVNDGTTQERLAAALDTTNNRLNVQLENMYMIKCHNFAQTLFNTERYYPWHDETESASPTDVESVFWAPYDMEFVKLMHRYADLSGAGAGIDVDFKIKTMADGGTSVADIGTMLNFSLAAADQDNIFESPASSWVFSGDNKISKGDAALISINPDSNLGAGTDKYYATSVWKIDLTS